MANKLPGSALHEVRATFLPAGSVAGAEGLTGCRRPGEWSGAHGAVRTATPWFLN